MPLCMLALWHLAKWLNKCYLWRQRIRGFLNSWINAYAIVFRCGKIAVCLFIRIWVSNRSLSLQSWSLLPLAFSMFVVCFQIAVCLFIRIWVSNRSSSLQSWSLLPLAFESYSLLCCLLALWAASYLENSYCVLRADIYLHYFVA